MIKAYDVSSVTVEILRARFALGADGILRRRFAMKAMKEGSEAGCVFRGQNNKPYKKLLVNMVPLLAHRVCWAVHYGEWPSDQIDHIDGNGLNNRISNLRVVDNTGNMRNTKMKRNNTSGVMGVSYHQETNKWRAYIGAGSKQIYLGLFDDFDQAVSARRLAEVHYGYHPNHGRSA